MRLRRVINTPKRGIGDRSVEIAAEIGQQTGETLFEVISHADEYPALSRPANKMKLFSAQMRGLIELNEDRRFRSASFTTSWSSASATSTFSRPTTGKRRGPRGQRARTGLEHPPL